MYLIKPINIIYWIKHVKKARIIIVILEY